MIHKLRWLYHRITRAIAGSEPLIKTFAIVDFTANFLLMLLHFTQHAYPGAPSEVFAIRITAITYFTPWHYFHMLVLILYLGAAVLHKGLKLAITLSWAVWACWSVLMFIWVVTAPVSWIPLVMGLLGLLTTTLARRAWVEKES